MFPLVMGRMKAMNEWMNELMNEMNQFDCHLNESFGHYQNHSYQLFKNYYYSNSTWNFVWEKLFEWKLWINEWMNEWMEEKNKFEYYSNESFGHVQKHSCQSLFFKIQFLIIIMNRKSRFVRVPLFPRQISVFFFLFIEK